MRPAIHPGEILADELAALEIAPTELARQLDVPPNRITQIMQGKRSITGDTALRLGHWFGTSAQFWLNLQSAYEIRVAEQKVGAKVARLPMHSDMGSRKTQIAAPIPRRLPDGSLIAPLERFGDRIRLSIISDRSLGLLALEFLHSSARET